MRDPGSSPRVTASRRSLSTRAALFTLMGSGAFFGALVVLSIQLVDDARARSLEERRRLARITARLLEAQLTTDMTRLTDAAHLLLRQEAGASNDGAHRAALAHAAAPGAFRAGAFVLDGEGRPLASASGPLDSFERVPSLDRLLADARARRAMVVSRLVHVDAEPRLVAAAPVPRGEEPARGFVVGLFSPQGSDLLHHLREDAAEGRAEIVLVDGAGAVVGSTDPGRSSYPRCIDALTRGLEERRAVVGACERCGGSEGGCEPGVMAFAPLPDLDLGLGFVQSRAIALAPARALQWRLWSLGGAVIVLFVVFNMLSVRSVVRPVTRLTRAVRRAAADGGPLSSRYFGRDEVGELADALEQARGQMLESLAAEGASKEALRTERDAVQGHLETLQRILRASTDPADLEGFVQAAVGQILAACDAQAGALCLEHAGQEVVAQVGLTEEEAARALAQLGEREPGDPAPGPRPCVRLDPVPRAGGALELIGRSLGSAEHGPRLALALAPQSDDPAPAPIWMESLLQHTAVAAAHVLLRASTRARQQQQGLYLQRILKAQEDERSRIARDLHDTVAQDLAALRLALERSANHAEEPKLASELEELEGSAKRMLETVRRILLDLRLSILDDMGLVPALRWMLERAETTSRLRPHLVVDGDEVELPYERAVALFRIAQEALLNVEQHAKAEHVFVTLRFSEALVELMVEDDGVGFELDERLRVRADGHGLGLLGMEERTKLLGGGLEVSSAPGEGTSVRVRVPLGATRPLGVDAMPLEIT